MAFYATTWGERLLGKLDAAYMARGVYGSDLYNRPLRRALRRIVRA